MAQETKVEETRCSLQTFERNRYFYGKPMTVSDFEAEQRYLIGKQRYVNRLVHGAGVLCGLEVTVPAGFSAERPTVEVADGAALDCCGNLIVVSRGGTAEVKGDFNAEGVNYLYLKYTECSKQPVMLAANGSSCEEVCCYNRIQETFEVVASRSAPGGETTAAAAPKKAAPASEGGAKPDPEALCRELTERYYQEHLRTCTGCDDPLVFLAALDAAKGEVDEAETAKYRSVVFNNPMLHELLCDHVTDFDNPHRVSAEQVKALQSVNGVGNNATRSFVANIDLRSPDNTLGVTPNKNALKIDLTLAANAVKTSHLNEDVINNLVRPSQTVNVEANAAAKTITLHTNPAKTVTSVGAEQVVGVSGSFAREDHAHDLAEGVVERRHFDPDVFASLVQGGGVIRVEGQAATRTIKISADVAAGEDPKLVSSVTGAKGVGKSERYAREDHAHDLFINGRSPNERGEFLLTAGANVRVEKGAADNELVISSEGGGRAVVATDVVVFEGVRPGEFRTSQPVAHRLDSPTVAVVLAQEELEGLRDASGTRLNTLRATARFGEVTAFSPEAPSLMAEVDFGQGTIQISLRDRRQDAGGETRLRPAGEGNFEFAGDVAAPRVSDETLIAPAPSGSEGDAVFEPDARTYRVRWWAIPA